MFFSLYKLFISHRDTNVTYNARVYFSRNDTHVCVAVKLCSGMAKHLTSHLSISTYVEFHCTYV